MVSQINHNILTLIIRKFYQNENQIFKKHIMIESLQTHLWAVYKTLNYFEGHLHSFIHFFNNVSECVQYTAPEYLEDYDSLN